MKLHARHLYLFLFIYLFAFFLFNLKNTANAQQPATTPPQQTQRVQKTPLGIMPDARTQMNRLPPIMEEKPKKSNVRSVTVRAGKVFAIFETSLGTFKARLFHTHAPKTVENFIALVEGTKEWKDPKSGELQAKPLYVNIPFHRVRKNFIIQTGDPYRDGRADVGFYINDEFHPDLKHNKPGILSMANQYPTRHTNSSQFFVTLKDLSGPNGLDGKNPIFGEVIEGMDVVTAISEVPTNRMTEKPNEDVLLKSVKIIRE